MSPLSWKASQLAETLYVHVTGARPLLQSHNKNAVADELLYGKLLHTKLMFAGIHTAKQHSVLTSQYKSTSFILSLKRNTILTIASIFIQLAFNLK